MRSGRGRRLFGESVHPVQVAALAPPAAFSTPNCRQFASRLMSRHHPCGTPCGWRYSFDWGLSVKAVSDGPLRPDDEPDERREVNESTNAGRR